MCNRKSLLAVVGAVVIGVGAAASAHAWPDHTNYVTFSGPFALPGVTLTAGTYMFRTPSDSDANIVQVMNRAGTKAYYMGLTTPVLRPSSQTALMVVVGEAPSGQAPPIRAWFPAGEREGHSFIYQR
jgi:hypothetical protein